MNRAVGIKANGKYDFWIFLSILFALSLFMVCWFGPVPEYSGHDYYFNTGRFNVLIQALKSGNYPVYIDYNALEGYGYFTKGFYPDLIILPFAILGIFTGVAAAYIVMIFTMTFLCGLFAYHAVNTVFKSTFVASVSAILYTFSAYHLFDWYNRAALGESLSFTFLPLIFLGLYHIIKGDYKKWYILTTGYSLLIYTHLLSSFLTFIALAIIVILCYKPLVKEPKRIAYLALAAVVTLPIVSSYVATLLEQMSSNTFYYSTKENITGQTKLGFEDLGWGALSGVVYPKIKNLAGIGPLLICLVILRFFVKEKTAGLKLADFCTLTGIILLVFASALFPWARLPLGFVQFPWRLYEFIIFFFAVGGAYYLSVILKAKKQYIIAGGCIVAFTLIVFAVNNNNYKYWQTLAKGAAPHWFTGEPSVENEYYLGGLEYLPVKVPSHHYIHGRGDSIKANNPDTKVVSTSYLPYEWYEYEVTVTSPDILELPLVYYKGYKAYTLSPEGKGEVPVTESENGLVQAEMNKPGHIRVYYTWTPIQQYSWYISILSSIGLVIFIVVSVKKRRRYAQ